MAKGAFLGVKRGKLGDAVGYNVANSSDGIKQGWRIYQPKVSNPQTDAQVDQRIKLTAANNLYRALKPIIQRGWENKKYGDESRRAFLQRALSGTFAGPYLPKGSTLAVPIEGVPITYGSLTPVAVECAEDTAYLINVPASAEGDPETIGALSTLFVNAHLALQGDQVTFVLASLNGAGTISYLTRSFYIDPVSTATVAEVLGFPLFSTEYEGENSVVAVYFSSITGLSASHFAMLVSISRDGATSNLRSYAEFAMSDAFRASFYGTAAQIQAAKASYRKKQSSSTNWPLDPDADEPTVQSAFTRAGTEITPVSLARKQDGDLRFEVIVDDNDNQYYIGTRPSAASTNIIYLASTSSTASASPSDLSEANSVNVFDSANVAAGLRAWLIAKGVSATVLPV